tara:strand:- start:1778 stop:2878 length:1101 start_codon:yes stop_codon:yes gene_type:complete
MKIKFLDLSNQHKKIEKKIIKKIRSVSLKSEFILSNEVKSFEKEFSKYCNAQYCIGVASGLDALILILRSLNIKNGDEVIVPSNTFIATWLAVSHVGATPIPVEPDEITYNINISSIEKVITKKTKAVIAVHLYGQPCDMKLLKKIKNKYAIKLIEDAAQAHGAKHEGNFVGSFSDAAAFSFYPGKNLGAFGDAGAVITNNKKIYSKINQLRNYGSVKKYYYDALGYNSRLDEIQASILSIKLKYLDYWNAHRRKIANYYLKNIDSSKIVLPLVPDSVEHVWHLFIIRLKKRNFLKNELLKNGVETGLHYPVPPHKQKIYVDKYKNYDLSLTENLSKEILSLPIGPELSLEKAKVIVDIINKIMKY